MKRGVAATQWRATQKPAYRGLFRTSARDSWVVFAALLQSAALVLTFWGATFWGSGFAAMVLPVVAFGTWWGANTVSHIHLHLPIFGSRKLNQLFFWWLTLSLAIPQTLWKRRHFWHHAGEPAHKRPGWDRDSLVEASVIVGLWAILAWFSPTVFFVAYLPGYLVALGLCQLQGYHEHNALGITYPDGISTYNKLHNWLWFNDGYHAEHHRWPTEHWTQLPRRRHEMEEHRTSRFSPMLRFLERMQGPVWPARILSWLEKVALEIKPVQSFLVRRHTEAFARVVRTIEGFDPQGILIVGGGLFPRSVLVVSALWPQAHIQVLDQDADHIVRAKQYLTERGMDLTHVVFRQDTFEPELPTAADLVILPLAYVGERKPLYVPRNDGAVTLIHDWWHTRRGDVSTPITIWVWKRLTLVLPAEKPFT
ncbi:MAG: fatty acid desaturase [Myxococcales bacterium]|nr:fatty acid desaturase [Myxococcales bacterium]